MEMTLNLTKHSIEIEEEEMMYLDGCEIATEMEDGLVYIIKIIQVVFFGIQNSI